MSNSCRCSTATQTQAAYQQALASRDLAALNLARSQVIAKVNGLITNFDMRPGEYVDAGKPIFALIDADGFRVEGYFEETRLPRIRPGDRARVYLIGENAIIECHVESSACGIADRERQGSADLLANVIPTFSWVRLAQRVPVRVALDRVPADVRLVTGRIGSPSPSTSVCGYFSGAIYVFAHLLTGNLLLYRAATPPSSQVRASPGFAGKPGIRPQGLFHIWHRGCLD